MVSRSVWADVGNGPTRFLSHSREAGSGAVDGVWVCGLLTGKVQITLISRVDEKPLLK